MDTKLDSFVESMAERMTPSDEKIGEIIGLIQLNIRTHLEKYHLKYMVMAAHSGLPNRLLAYICQEEFIGTPLAIVGLTDVDERTQHARLYNFASDVNGMVLGSDTWTDWQLGTYHTGIHYDYCPFWDIGRGFELPAIARYLGIEPIVDDGDYRMVDVVLNAYLGNFDSNLSTQMQRFRHLPEIEEILMHHEFGKIKRLQNCAVSRESLGLPTKYGY